MSSLSGAAAVCAALFSGPAASNVALHAAVAAVVGYFLQGLWFAGLFGGVSTRLKLLEKNVKSVDGIVVNWPNWACHVSNLLAGWVRAAAIVAVVSISQASTAAKKADATPAARGCSLCEYQGAAFAIFVLEVTAWTHGEFWSQRQPQAITIAAGAALATAGVQSCVLWGLAANPSLLTF